MNPAFLKVLFVHGNCQELMAAAIILDRVGPDVHPAATLEEVVRNVEGMEFDLIVQAGNFGNLQGPQVFRSLPPDARASTLIVMDPAREHGDEWDYPGALDIIEKPLSPIGFVATVCEYLIEKYETEHEVFPQTLIH